jgi:hypothetical protein
MCYYLCTYKNIEERKKEETHALACPFARLASLGEEKEKKHVLAHPLTRLISLDRAR